MLHHLSNVPKYCTQNIKNANENLDPSHLWQNSYYERFTTKHLLLIHVVVLLNCSNVVGLTSQISSSAYYISGFCLSEVKS